MKKILMILVGVITLLFISTPSSAQNRIKVANGVYIATYGSVTVLENDNTQQTIQIKVKKSNNLYDVFCGNQSVKRVTKSVLRNTIKTLLTKVTGGMSWVGGTIIDEMVNVSYDAICDYYKE
ncbi:MAG: hypothetical protein J6A70_02965 [Prevotella sp.]|nr:hypothetical protein [Prevotella sp.]